MKFALALFEYFPFGGLQRDMLAIAREIIGRGHQVTIYTRHWEGEHPEGMQVICHPSKALSNHQRDADFAQWLAGQWSDFDIRLGFNKMPGLDWYYAADGCLAPRYQGLKRLLPRYRTRLNMEYEVFGKDKRVKVLSISPPQRKLYQQWYATPSSNFVDLPPGIRRDRAVPADIDAIRETHRQRLGLKSTDTMMLFVGSGFRTKGLDRALRLLSRLPEAQLYVVGADKDEAYRRQAKKLGVMSRLHFMGGQDNVPEWLWSADFLVHPAYAENTGTVLLEAAIAGLPVLASDACGYAPYIEQAGMGEILSAFDDATMLAAVERIGAVPRSEWLRRSKCFEQEADIFSLVEHCVNALEEMA